MNLPRTFVLTVRRQIRRFDDTVAHLDSLGVKWERFDGMDNTITKLIPVETFDFDRAGDKIGPKHVAATLTHYLLWKVMQYQPDDSFIALEFDVRFVDDWQDKFHQAMSVLPDDWDIVYLGSCCCKGRNTSLIGNNLYVVEYPLCGHACLYRKKCLETLLDIHQRISMPLDIAMLNWSLPKLKVYTILPPICVQHNTIVAP